MRDPGLPEENDCVGVAAAAGTCNSALRDSLSFVATGWRWRKPTNHTANVTSAAMIKAMTTLRLFIWVILRTMHA